MSYENWQDKVKDFQKLMCATCKVIFPGLQNVQLL